MRALTFVALLGLLAAGMAAATYYRTPSNKTGPPRKKPRVAKVTTDADGTPVTRLPVKQTHSSYLTEDERRLLFDVERADLLLGHALKPFYAGIRSADRDALARLFATDFRASVFEMPDRVAITPGKPYTTVRLEDGHDADRDAFLDWLVALRARFERIEAVSFGRKKVGREAVDGTWAMAESTGAFRIAGVGPGGEFLEVTGDFALEHRGFDVSDEGDEPDNVEKRESWMHRLKLSHVVEVAAGTRTFEDFTDRCGIDPKAFHDNWKDKAYYDFAGGPFLGDVDQDGHLDLVLTEMGRGALYLGRGDGSFSGPAWESPKFEVVSGAVTEWTVPFAAIFDATADGAPEVLFGGKLYRWDGGQRTLVPLPEATPLPNADAALCDFDRDGRTDLYFLNAGVGYNDTGTKGFFDNERIYGNGNLLYRNLGGGKFEDVTDRANASPQRARAFAATWLYANADPWPDLFVANEFGRNLFLIGRENGVFEEVDDIDREFGGFSMGVTSGDLDEDGDVDIYVANMYSKAGHRIFHHLPLEVYPLEVRHMFVASVTGNRLYRARGDLTFEELGAQAGVNAVGWGWSGAMSDFDLDGRLDLYAPAGYNSSDPTKPDG